MRIAFVAEFFDRTASVLRRHGRLRFGEPSLSPPFSADSGLRVRESPPPASLMARRPDRRNDTARSSCSADQSLRKYNAFGSSVTAAKSSASVVTTTRRPSASESGGVWLTGSVGTTVAVGIVGSAVTVRLYLRGLPLFLFGAFGSGVVRERVRGLPLFRFGAPSSVRDVAGAALSWFLPFKADFFFRSGAAFRPVAVFRLGAAFRPVAVFRLGAAFRPAAFRTVPVFVFGPAFRARTAFVFRLGPSSVLRLRPRRGFGGLSGGSPTSLVTRLWRRPARTADDDEGSPRNDENAVGCSTAVTAGGSERGDASPAASLPPPAFGYRRPSAVRFGSAEYHDSCDADCCCSAATLAAAGLHDGTHVVTFTNTK